MIADMDSTYAGAELTIIAAAGDVPDFGLPGVTSNPRKGPYSTRLSHGVLDTVTQPLIEIHGTVWASRGWTYQEIRLSRRTLIFIEAHMTFQCDNIGFMNGWCRPGVITASGHRQIHMRII